MFDTVKYALITILQQKVRAESGNSLLFPYFSILKIISPTDEHFWLSLHCEILFTFAKQYTKDASTAKLTPF